MKPLYRFYANLGITLVVAAIAYCLYHFAGPASLVLLIVLIPFVIMAYVSVNCK